MKQTTIRGAAMLGMATALLMSVATSATAAGGAAQAADSTAAPVHRAGVMATVGQAAQARTAHAAARAAAPDVDAKTLAYNGGIGGAGVMSGAKTKVYLVFYGNQWGKRSTDANGNAKFSGDPAGVASAAQQMFKGIGTNGETWSADLTQWCDGKGVAKGALACPANLPASQFVPYQAGGVLAGVWYDNAGPEPENVNGHGLALEANKAAGHFGNTTAAANRNAYYVIMSPHGTNPDGYKDPKTGYCAWHDWNNDAVNLPGGAAPSAYGNDIAFSNQPYNVDVDDCGKNWVNAGAAGALDGYTMTLGHEWHETLSDPYPSTGWVNPGTHGGTKDYENSDECAWIAAGRAGGAQNVNFGPFGSYAEQASWSNDTDFCAISHPIVNHGGGNLNGTHVLTVSGGFALDDPHSSTVHGEQLITWAKNGGSNQKWVFTQQPDGSYTIANGSSKLCLDDNGWKAPVPGTAALQYPCTGATIRHWTVAQLPSGAYTIANSSSGLLLTTAYAKNGSLVTEEPNTNSPLQQWTIS
ncbi:RICIN domain-containing protein [Kitasatospora paracochleata]|uniref:Serine protease n=2 Tax=Kitasatospora paracochleata TaxID=58354 RepID=A0ABT1JA26_9ACTN|nr:RICIN domain-containing protein [Kitasatospora paracochleata]MCP2314223.1 serine protease [Kitasatospora paracochleata]